MRTSCCRYQAIYGLSGPPPRGHLAKLRAIGRTTGSALATPLNKIRLHYTPLKSGPTPVVSFYTAWIQSKPFCLLATGRLPGESCALLEVRCRIAHDRGDDTDDTTRTGPRGLVLATISPSLNRISHQSRANSSQWRIQIGVPGPQAIRQGQSASFFDVSQCRD